jgi:hypothetical protein
MTSGTSAPSDVRIQLEGRLEVVEALIARWRAAAVALDHPAWAENLGWLGVASTETEDEAVRLVKIRAGDAGVDPTMAELAAAQAKVRGLTEARLWSLSVEAPASSSTLELLQLLKVQRPLHSLEVRRRGLVEFPDVRLFFGAFGGFMVWLFMMAPILGGEPPSEYSGPALMVSLLGCVTLGIRFARPGAKAGLLLLTEGGLRLTTEEAPILMPLEGLVVAVNPDSQGRFLVRLHSMNQRFELETPTDPAGLIAHLQERGVHVASESAAPPQNLNRRPPASSSSE